MKMDTCVFCNKSLDDGEISRLVDQKRDDRNPSLHKQGSRKWVENNCSAMAGELPPLYLIFF